MSTPQTATCITLHVYVASFGTNTQSAAAGFGVPYDVLNQLHLVRYEVILVLFYRCLLTIDLPWPFAIVNWS